MANLKSEQNRKDTFNDTWPAKFIDTDLMARTGFFYTGSDDTVRYVFCLVNFNNWTPDDDIVMRHATQSPHCRLITRRITSNQPINVHLLNNALPPHCFTTDETPLIALTSFSNKRDYMDALQIMSMLSKASLNTNLIHTSLPNLQSDILSPPFTTESPPHYDSTHSLPTKPLTTRKLYRKIHTYDQPTPPFQNF